MNILINNHTSQRVSLNVQVFRHTNVTWNENNNKGTSKSKRSVLARTKEKGKEEYLYSAILADTTLTKRSDMDHTVLPANYTMSASPS